MSRKRIIVFILTVLVGIFFYWLLAVSPSLYKKDTVINSESSYPESPVMIDGSLYYAEYAAGQVIKWNGSDQKVFWKRNECGPAAIMASLNDTVMVTCYDTDTVFEISDKGVWLYSVTSDSVGNTFNGPNDMTEDSSGGIYFTASGEFDPAAPATGEVHYINDKKFVTRVATGLHYPNGIAIINQGKTLLVNEHMEQRIVSFTIEEEGSLSSQETFLDLSEYFTDDLSGYAGPDGLSVDNEGNIYIAAFGMSQVLLFDRNKNLMDTVIIPEKYVTNIGLGDNGEQLYVTAVSDAFTEPYNGTVYKYIKKN